MEGLKDVSLTSTQTRSFSHNYIQQKVDLELRHCELCICQPDTRSHLPRTLIRLIATAGVGGRLPILLLGGVVHAGFRVFGVADIARIPIHQITCRSAEHHAAVKLKCELLRTKVCVAKRKK